MMQPVNNINSVTPRDTVTDQARHTERNGKPAAGNRVADRVEISGGGEQLANFEIARDERSARIDRVQNEIRQGTYETEHRIDRVVEAVFRELAALDLRA